MMIYGDIIVIDLTLAAFHEACSPLRLDFICQLFRLFSCICLNVDRSCLFLSISRSSRITTALCKRGAFANQSQRKTKRSIYMLPNANLARNNWRNCDLYRVCVYVNAMVYFSSKNFGISFSQGERYTSSTRARVQLLHFINKQI